MTIWSPLLMSCYKGLEYPVACSCSTLWLDCNPFVLDLILCQIQLSECSVCAVRFQQQLSTLTANFITHQIKLPRLQFVLSALPKQQNSLTWKRLHQAWNPLDSVRFVDLVSGPLGLQY